ncbi:DUF4367 domain-containing protein [Neobacillus sp. PS3-40]|uniref:DUF4367 domain-containing protein n=1 Tax=Neobacillus sp. PS3-40 TaxID=3070679 RepID=UPI0027DF15EB|nr:DUF4367 domain-containing protein [Neobacillus sp. PS3-40]WML44190.1 DUF4367 domain-containing protein [Neobacillus sp. PS3-40]
MTNPKNELKTQLNKEFDLVLFESLDFHLELKGRVRENIKFNKKQTGLKNKTTNRMIRAIIFAAVICLFLPSSITIRDSDIYQTSNQGSKMDTLLKSDRNTKLIMEPDTIKSWDLKKESDALESLGGNLVLPTYIPNNFKPERLRVLGTSKEQADKAIFTYVSGSQSYLIIVEKSSIQTKPVGYIEVDLNGVTGYLKSVENNEAELQWVQNGFRYTINGLISAEEVVKIARSRK